MLIGVILVDVVLFRLATWILKGVGLTGPPVRLF